MPQIEHRNIVPGSPARICSEIVADALAQHGYSIDPTDYHGLHEVGYGLINERLLHGAAALCLLESTKHGFYTPHDLETPRGDALLFHGSPVSPEQMGRVIEPRSCHRVIIDTGETKVDPRCSSHSSSILFPKMRALLHHNHPDLQEVDSPLVLSRRQNKIGAVFSITFRKVLERLVERGSVGWVYAGSPRTNNFLPNYTHADQKEYRTTQNVGYLHAIQISVYDLPANLIVLDGSDEAIWRYLKTFKDAISFQMHAARLGISALKAAQLVPELAGRDCIQNGMSIQPTTNPYPSYDFKLCHSDTQLAAESAARKP